MKGFLQGLRKAAIPVKEAGLEPAGKLDGCLVLPSSMYLAREPSFSEGGVGM